MISAYKSVKTNLSKILVRWYVLLHVTFTLFFLTKLVDMIES